jgi:hypothetical protein
VSMVGFLACTFTMQGFRFFLKVGIFGSRIFRVVISGNRELLDTSKKILS